MHLKQHNQHVDKQADELTRQTVKDATKKKQTADISPDWHTYYQTDW